MAALNRLIRTATETGNGDSSTSHERARMTKSGLPGGCAIPMMWELAIYSLVSQNAVVGAMVITYSAKTAAAAARAYR
jgi:hypothetical protein